MALIKKCAICSNKGFSLKLSDGLCPDCAKELKGIEQSYISTLQKISTSTYDKIEATNSIKEILLKLPKFSKMDCSVKLDDCINLLSNLNTNVEPTINDIDSTKNSEFKEGEPVLNAYSFTEDIVSSKSITPTIFIESDQDKIIDEETDVVDEVIYSNESIESLESLLSSLAQSSDADSSSESDSNSEIQNSSEIEVDTDLEVKSQDNYSTNDNIVEDSVKYGPTSTITDYTDDNIIEDSTNTCEEISDEITNDISDDMSDQHIDSIGPLDSKDDTLEPSSSVVKNNLYIQTSKLIAILQDKQSSINDLAQNLFLLKDTYLPVLKENSIFEVDDVNLESLIKTVTKTLVLRTNQKESDLYDFFNYVAYAIQTNGIRTKSNDIIEISALKVRYGKIVDKFYTLINPLKSIELHVQSTTGITNDSILDAPTFDVAIPDFITFTDGLKLISHNSKFMSAFLINKYNILYDTPLPNKFGCSMDLYRLRYKAYHGDPATDVDILSCARDVLSFDNVQTINSYTSIATSICYGTYELYEKLKFRYK